MKEQMKEKISEKIKSIGLCGIMHYNETKLYNDFKFASLEYLYKYRLSKIKIFLDENDIILGFQAFYKNSKNEELPGEEVYNHSIKEKEIKTFEIPGNDYLCNLNVWVGDDHITKLKFATKKGKEIVVGINKGEDISINIINVNTKNIILCLTGGYQKRLELIGCRYLNIDEYFLNSNGFFELHKKLKHEDYKEKIKTIYNSLDESDQVLYNICCLPDNIFNEIIKYFFYFHLYKSKHK